MAETNILDLPEEILEIIFRQLSIHDVQQKLAKVCKQFFKISSLPGMVKDFRLTIEYLGDAQEMQECLAKAQNVVENFPGSKLELIEEQRFSTLLAIWHEPAKPLFKSLEPFTPFLKKLAIKTKVSSEFESRLIFEALEYL